MDPNSIALLIGLIVSNVVAAAYARPGPPCPPGPGPCPPGPPYHHPHGPPPLPFLRNVNRDEIRQFFQIVSSENGTKSAIKSDLANWAQTAGVSIAYNNFTTKVQQFAQQFHDNVTSNLAGQALQLFNQLWNIRQDDSITRVAECQQFRAAMNGTGPLLHRLVPMPPPAIPGPPPRGCHPRPGPHPPHGSHSHSHSHSHEGGGGFDGQSVEADELD